MNHDLCVRGHAYVRLMFNFASVTVETNSRNTHYRMKQHLLMHVPLVALQSQTAKQHQQAGTAASQGQEGRQPGQYLVMPSGGDKEHDLALIEDWSDDSDVR